MYNAIKKLNKFGFHLLSLEHFNLEGYFNDFNSKKSYSDKKNLGRDKNVEPIMSM